MSYTSSDPEYLYRDPDSSSLASTSTTATSTSQQSTKKKKPWSKFKSSIKSIGEKMSARPKFTDPTESSEQRRVKKGKKGKAGGSGEPKSSTPGETPREKSPTKSLMKKLSVESISTPFVGYQPALVSPAKSYARALHKSGSTSESNLSASDIDTPKKSLTLDRNIKLAQESPDSGRASQTMGSLEGSRPPSQIKEVASDVSVDSDYTSPRHGGLEEEVLDDLVTKTEQFAQSLVSPKGKEKDIEEVSAEFLKAETVVKTPSSEHFESDDPPKEGDKQNKSQSKIETPSQNVKEDKNDKKSNLVHETKVGDEDGVDGRKKKRSDRGSKKEDSSLGLINSERSLAVPINPDNTETKQPESKETIKSKSSEENPDSDLKPEKSIDKDRSHEEKDSNSDKDNSASKGLKDADTNAKPETKSISTTDEKKETTDKQVNEINKPTPESKSETTINEKTDTPYTVPKEEKPTTDSAEKEDPKPKTPPVFKDADTNAKPETKSISTTDEKKETTDKQVNEINKPTPESKSETTINEKTDKSPYTVPKEEKPTTDSAEKEDPKPKTPPVFKDADTNAKPEKKSISTTDEKKETTDRQINEINKPTPESKSETAINEKTDKSPYTVPKEENPTTDSAEKEDPKPKTPPTKSDGRENAALSTTSTKTQDLPSHLADLGPATPETSMSVEEKLQAFLSLEGWSGTIKDIPAESSSDGSQQPDKRECLYKILVIGELGTGKTSIIKRYVHQFFSQHYRATIGVDFALKVLNWDQNTIIRLQLWDIAGQERFGNMTRVYYKEAVGAFIVFDVTRSATFDAVLKWKQDLDSKVQLADGSHIPCVLLANKCDQQKEGIVNTPAKMDEYCKENNFSAWFETSAKENINIDEAAKSLVTQILQNDKSSQNGRDSARDGGKFPLDGKSEQESKLCAC